MGLYTDSVSVTPDETQAKRNKRRRRVLLGLVALPCLLWLYAWQIEPRWGVLSEFTVGEGPTAVRVLQITDVHTHGLGSMEQWVFDTVAARKPELIVVTGDMVNSGLTDAEREAAIEFLRRLKAPLGVYAVSGNHEEWEGERGMTIFADAGVPLLDRKQVSLLDGRLTLTGMAQARETPLPPTDGFDVALCHYPASLPQTNLPGWAYRLYELNPMAGAISLIRVVFLDEPVPASMLTASIVGTLIFLLVGLALFRRLAPRFPTAG